jgi:hypothetical protein
MSKPGYLIIKETSSENLASAVSEQMTDGYVPIGSFVHTNGWYLQAVYIPKPIETRETRVRGFGPM